MSRGGCSRS
eukprot:gene25992-biopygen17901